MNRYLIKTPNWLKSFYHNQIWDLPNKNKEIYLTFDDGPTPEITDWVLNILQQYKAKATFFCIGRNIEKNPTIFNRIIQEGHSIGNHTYNHEKGWETNNEIFINSILKTERVIESIAKTKTTKLFRPPYGRIKKSQTKLLLKNDYKIIMWSVLSADFDRSVNVERCLNNVIKNTKSGDIIVFHDSEKAFDKLKEVLPKVLEYFNKKDFIFNKID